jgi:hypothetical protein
MQMWRGKQLEEEVVCTWHQVCVMPQSTPTSRGTQDLCADNYSRITRGEKKMGRAGIQWKSHWCFGKSSEGLGIMHVCQKASEIRESGATSFLVAFVHYTTRTRWHVPVEHSAVRAVPVVMCCCSRCAQSPNNVCLVVMNPGRNSILTHIVRNKIAGDHLILV